MRIFTGLILVLLVIQSAEAKSQILVLGGTPNSCRGQVDQVRAVLVSLPLPDDWTFIVVCSPLAWDNLLRRVDGLGKTHTGFTNLETHYTFFNGLMFAPRVAAHELGHILGKTTSEDKAEQLGVSLLRKGQIRPNTSALVGPQLSAVVVEPARRGKPQ